MARAKITRLDPEIKQPRFGELEPGDMFRFVASGEDAVYMRTETAQQAIFLPTGNIYNGMKPDPIVERVHKIQIEK